MMMNYEYVHDNDSQYPTFEEWCSGFLARVVAESVRLLRPGGVLLLNVSDFTRKRTRRGMCMAVLEQVAKFKAVMLPVGVWGYQVGDRGWTGREEGRVAEPVYVWRRSLQQQPGS